MRTEMHPVAQTDPSGWHAKLALRFERQGSRTILRRLGGVGPMYVQKSFYPEGGLCHSYLLHPPGGVVGGDALTLNVELAPDSQALLTTPASTKFYRSTGASAHQQQRFLVEERASLEYLPQGAIVFSGAEVHCSNTFELAPDACLLTADVLCLGQPALKQPFDRGRYCQTLRIQRRAPGAEKPRPLLEDRLVINGGGSLQRAPWGLDGRYCLGTCYATPIDADQLKLLRRKHPQLALTCVRTVLIARVLGDDAETVGLSLRALWRDLRPLLLKRTAAPPAIWKT